MDKYIFQLPKLSYNYEDLEPHISRHIMELHHAKHHQAYIDKLNGIVSNNASLQGKELSEIISSVSSMESDIKQSIINFGGGHYNHSLFWQFMAPNAGGEPGGELGEAIRLKYGSFQLFVDEFTKVSLGLFGSGWSWLMPDLSIVTTANQDTPLMNGSDEPLLGLDVWEHAYYLDYKNKRDDYVRAWWNVVNWPMVEKNYLKFK